MALASWMGHEKAMAKEVKRVLEREETKPLYIREEHRNSMVFISTHNLITNDPQLAPRYVATQEKSVTHFEETLRLLGDESQKAHQRIWSTLTYSVKLK